jgi:single-strand DNA-binding protein
VAVNNHVALTGNLVGEVETRQFDGDRVMGKFTIAVDRIGDKKGGTDFVRIVVWNTQATNTARYCGKGSKVQVSGRLRSGSYNKTNADGVIEKRYTTEVVAEQVEFLSPRPAAASPAPVAAGRKAA